MTDIIVDTSVIIDFLRSKDKEASLFVRLVSEGHALSISIITHAELYACRSVWENKSARNELSILLSGLSLVPLEQRISQEAGRLRASYDIDLFDAIIAASATVTNRELATLNIKHFQPIPGLKLSSF